VVALRLSEALARGHALRTGGEDPERLVAPCVRRRCDELKGKDDFVRLRSRPRLALVARPPVLARSRAVELRLALVLARIGSVNCPPVKRLDSTTKSKLPSAHRHRAHHPVTLHRRRHPEPTPMGPRPADEEAGIQAGGIG